MPGQINRGSLLGDAIYHLSLVSAFKAFLEIGTWDGRGSTRCFMDGLLTRADDACLWSLETNSEFLKKAKWHWTLHLIARGFLRASSRRAKLKLVHGRIIEPEELPTVHEITTSFGFHRQHFDLWYQSDITSYKKCPNVLPLLPETIDVLLLDGGEYSTYVEFQKLRGRSSVILLDDTMTSKCHEAMVQLKSDCRFTTLIDDAGERNGIFISCRNECVALLGSCRLQSCLRSP